MNILLRTNIGSISLFLDDERAPITVANFTDYIMYEFYKGTIFHRVIPGFMIQGGGFNSKMVEKETRDSIENEANNGLKNDKGTIAMARTPAPHSASSQFFINVSDNDFLNFSSETPDGWGYAVFGKVTEGMDIVEKIASVKTTTQGMHQDVPKSAVTIREVSIIEVQEEDDDDGADSIKEE